MQRTRLVLRRDNGAGYRLNRKAMAPLKIWRQHLPAGRKSATIDPINEYHLGELEIALDPSRPEHIPTDVRATRVGIVDLGCGMGQLFCRGGGNPAGVGRHGFDVDKASIACAIKYSPERANSTVAPMRIFRSQCLV